MTTLLLIGLLAAFLAALARAARPAPRGVVEHLVVGFRELRRLHSRQVRLWDRHLAELYGYDRAD